MLFLCLLPTWGLQALKDQLEMVAHATNILAVGLEPRAAASNSSAPQSPMPHASLAPNATGGRESRQAAGAYDRLLKLLGSQVGPYGSGALKCTLGSRGCSPAQSCQLGLVEDGG